MASGYDELHLLYPNLSLLSAIALTIPVSSVNCERDFSAMNRVSFIMHTHFKITMLDDYRYLIFLSYIHSFFSLCVDQDRPAK